MPAFKALIDQFYIRTYQVAEPLRSDGDLGALAAAIEAGQKDPAQIICQTPAWVAGRLWEARSAGDETNSGELRRWVDLWGLLQFPPLVPGEVWRPPDADAFRTTALSVITSEPGMAGWPETRAAYILHAALANNAQVASVEQRIPEPPITAVGRALWFESRVLEPSFYETLRSCGDIFGLVRLLLTEVAAADHGPAPHPVAVLLIDLAIERAEFFANLLFQMRQHPVLLADLLLHPPTTALACLLIAQWRAPTEAWDRNLSARDNLVSEAEAFGDAAAVLGEYLRDGRAAPAETAALLNWFHRRGKPEFVDDAAGNDAMLATLRRELSGLGKDVLRQMVEAFSGPDLARGLGASEFAAVLDLIDLGDLVADVDPAAVVDAYVQSVRAGEYSLTAYRVGLAGAATLSRLAARTPELRRTFLFPLQIPERLQAMGPDENPVGLADSIGRSVRAHIRILCRAIAGLRDNIPQDLPEALVTAIRAGAVKHDEKGRTAAFAPHFEASIAGPAWDRPLAADLGAALAVLDDQARTTTLDAILETDEPAILAQLLSCTPAGLRSRIERRITALAPSDAGAIRSLTEMQARIDNLLTAGVGDVAERYMVAELELKTFGPVPGRELARFTNQLRLHYVRQDWQAINNMRVPTLQPAPDQAAAQETFQLFQGVAALKGPAPNPERAKSIFAGLFARRHTIGYATNWFAAEISRLLGANSFALLEGDDLRDGRQALIELERMLALVPSEAAFDEAMEYNKAALFLALGEPAQALAVITAISGDRLRDTAAAYRALALARLGQVAEANSALDTAAHTYGMTPVIVAARAHIASGSGFLSVPDVNVADSLLSDVSLAIARFKTMSPFDQARVLDAQPDPFERLVVEHIRCAADSLLSLVAMVPSMAAGAEDDVTALLHHFLVARVQFLGWSVWDQSRRGFSEKGNPGECDLALMWGNTTLALIEAIVCDQPLSQDSMCADLESHFQKLLGYGTTTLFFHVTYAYLEDKASLMTFLEGISESASPRGFTFKGRDPISHTDSRPTGFVARYDADGGEVKVIFLVLDLGQKRQRDAARTAAATRRRNSPRQRKKPDPAQESTDSPGEIV
jgi:hypothetical protein